jgi:hypothetical protein
MSCTSDHQEHKFCVTGVLFMSQGFEKFDSTGKLPDLYSAIAQLDYLPG